MQTPLEPLSCVAAIGMQSISHAFYHLHGWLRSLDESEAFTNRWFSCNLRETQITMVK